MKFALVSPYQSFNLNLSYNLVLAQYLNTTPGYRNYYMEARRRGHFTMLDNGAAENGSSIEFHELVNLASQINADEIVLPDVLDDCDGTLRATQLALHFVPYRRRAVVPQGKNWDEWEYCAKELMKMKPRTICIAKRYEKFPGGRVEATAIIKDHKWHGFVDVHLLGCSSNPLEEIRRINEKAPWVRGIDTAAPASYAQAGERIDNPKATWHSMQWDQEIPLPLLEHNITAIVEACNAYHYKEPSDQ